MHENDQKHELTATDAETPVEAAAAEQAEAFPAEPETASAPGSDETTGSGKKAGPSAAKKSSATKRPGAKPLDAAARRKQALKEEKLRINADLKKTARKIMLGGTVSTLVAVAGLGLITTSHGGVGGKIGGLLLFLGVIGFGVLGGIVYRMYSSGQEATRKKQLRQRSQMARQDMHQFISNLSVETREKLMQVDAREKVAGGKTAEVMFLKLNDDELSNALQFLCMTSRAGEVELSFDNDAGQAVLHLGDGTVLFARYGEHTGLEAIARMLKAGAAEVSFYEGRVAPEKNIDMPISGILLNASVMSDEM
ncbi:MAG: DUF4388 domain-containing protein [Lentisphaeria bacterium]|nr:DUF4388 domain-containing protein [Lentisphaeria bacterium]